MTDDIKTPDRPICQYCGKTPRTTLKNHWKHCDKKPKNPPGRPGRPKGSTGTRKGGKTGGRKAGVRNKSTLTAKQQIQEVFEQLGGVKAMVNWASQNQTDFYTKIYPKIIPIDTVNKHNIDGMKALNITLTHNPDKNKKDDGDDD